MIVSPEPTMNPNMNCIGILRYYPICKLHIDQCYHKITHCQENNYKDFPCNCWRRWYKGSLVVDRPNTSRIVDVAMSKPTTEPIAGIKKQGWTEMAVSCQNLSILDNLSVDAKCTKNMVLARALNLYEIVSNASIREDVMITICEGKIKGIRGSCPEGDSPKGKGRNAQ